MGRTSDGVPVSQVPLASISTTLAVSGATRACRLAQYSLSTRYVAVRQYSVRHLSRHGVHGWDEQCVRLVTTTVHTVHTFSFFHLFPFNDTLSAAQLRGLVLVLCTSTRFDESRYSLPPSSSSLPNHLAYLPYVPYHSSSSSRTTSNSASSPAARWVDGEKQFCWRVLAIQIIYHVSLTQSVPVLPSRSVITEFNLQCMPSRLPSPISHPPRSTRL